MRTAELEKKAETKKNRIVRGGITLLVALALWYLPIPAGVADKAWHLFAIFFATIIGLILQPVPMGAVVLIGITATTVTGTLPIGDALNGYMNSTVWLIVAAFLFARAFSKTGLGRRIAYFFIRAFGHRTLGLAYALGMADLVLAPGIPSGAARTAGVLFPVVKSLASTYGSEPGATAGPDRHLPDAQCLSGPRRHLCHVPDFHGGQSAHCRARPGRRFR